MSESRTTFEEAKVCPKCAKPGEDRMTKPAGRDLPLGTTIHMIYCNTELCPWYNTCWMVQVNPDGSIPPPKNHTMSPKLYSGFEGHNEEAERVLAYVKAEEARQREVGAEIRNPRG